MTLIIEAFYLKKRCVRYGAKEMKNCKKDKLIYTCRHNVNRETK